MAVLDGTASPALARARGTRTFFGQPPALGFLAFTEAWERFSYYGMTSLLVLYMSQALFMREHIGHIAGLTAYRAMLEGVFGKMSTLALAKFEEAAKYAPNWGRLYLKWGEALLWSGDKPNAQKQFATTAHLDLTPPEKLQLARVGASHER